MELDLIKTKKRYTDEMDSLGSDTKYVRRANEIFMFKEPIVLLPIICLSALRGIGSTVDQERFYTHLEEEKKYLSFQYYSIIHTIGLVPGMFLTGILSEVHGRKLVLTLLFSLSLLSSILSYIPYVLAWSPLALIGSLIVATLKGGVLTITGLAICEYCSPKHRFAYLVADVVVKICGAHVTSILYSQKVLSTDSSCVSLLEALVAVGCLVSVYWWPESPYWLVGQGRFAEGRAALLRLRGEGRAAREELAALETARRRPSPKLFWLALIIGLLAITLAKFSFAEEILLLLNSSKPQLSQRFFVLCANVVILIVFVLISYRLKRKVIYLCTTIVPLVLVYALSIWMCVEDVNEHAAGPFYIIALICGSLLECGPFNLNFALFIEAIPQKYYTYLSCICSIYFYGISLFIPTLNMIYSHVIPLPASLLLFATLSLIAMGLLLWLSQETQGKHLLEIEKEYLKRLYPCNAEHIPVIPEDESRL